MLEYWGWRHRGWGAAGAAPWSLCRFPAAQLLPVRPTMVLRASWSLLLSHFSCCLRAEPLINKNCIVPRLNFILLECSSQKTCAFFKCLFFFLEIILFCLLSPFSDFEHFSFPLLLWAKCRILGRAHEMQKASSGLWNSNRSLKSPCSHFLDMLWWLCRHSSSLPVQSELNSHAPLVKQTIGWARN